jgi:hypothetical protein
MSFVQQNPAPEAINSTPTMEELDDLHYQEQEYYNEPGYDEQGYNEQGCDVLGFSQADFIETIFELRANNVFKEYIGENRGINGIGMFDHRMISTHEYLLNKKLVIDIVDLVDDVNHQINAYLSARRAEPETITRKNIVRLFEEKLSQINEEYGIYYETLQRYDDFLDELNPTDRAIADELNLNREI